jgi:hypothetical protein
MTLYSARALATGTGRQEERSSRAAVGRYELSEGRAIADNMLLFRKRTAAGRRTKHAGHPDRGAADAVTAPSATNTTLTTARPIRMSCCWPEAFQRAADARYRESCLRDRFHAGAGAAGGQFYPRSGYKEYITFNDGDDRVLSLLLRISQETRRSLSIRAGPAARGGRSGVGCILRCQIERRGSDRLVSTAR